MGEYTTSGGAELFRGSRNHCASASVAMEELLVTDAERVIANESMLARQKGAAERASADR